MNEKHQVQEAFLLIAISDPTLHTEAMNLAAASNRPVIDVASLADVPRLIPRAAAVFIDAETVHVVGTLPRHDAVFFLSHDATPIDFEAALASHAAHALLLPAQATEVLEKLSTVAHDATRRSQGRVASVGITSSAGGVGVSTMAAIVAGRAKQVADVTLVDADPLSGGLDLLVGAENTSGARWPDLIAGASGGGSITAQDVRAALPFTDDGIAVITAARGDGTDSFEFSSNNVNMIAQALNTSDTSHITVFDHPPGTVDSPADLLVVITPLELRPAAAASKHISRLKAHQRSFIVLARHRGWAGINVQELQSLVGTAPLTEIPTVRSLPKAAEMTGLPLRIPRQLTEVADQILAEVGVKIG